MRVVEGRAGGVHAEEADVVGSGPRPAAGSVAPGQNAANKLGVGKIKVQLGDPCVKTHHPR
uniref:hypothetical protein n=1 Tax=Nocardia abscessus TaxID=120957 RepID=UPI002453958A